MDNLQLTAKTAQSYFERNPHDNWATKLDAPEWVKNMVRSAHGDFMPDDYRYNWIYNALDAFQNDTPDVAIDCLEPEPYYNQRASWLASNVNRAQYVNEIIEMGCESDDVMDMIGYGQLQEMRETYESVHSSILTQSALLEPIAA